MMYHAMMTQHVTLLLYDGAPLSSAQGTIAQVSSNFRTSPTYVNRNPNSYGPTSGNQNVPNAEYA